MSLTQAQAEASPYWYTFTAITARGNVVVAKRRQRGCHREFQGSNAAAALAKVNSYETYLSNMGVSVTQF